MRTPLAASRLQCIDGTEATRCSVPLFHYSMVAPTKKKKMPKKAIAHKRFRGSSSSNFDPKRFVSVDAEARFHDLVTCRSGLKERSFDIDIESPRVEYYRQIIECRGWQELCKHPKAAAMTVVCKFYVNA